MGLGDFLSLLRAPHAWSLVLVSRDLRAFARLNFLHAAFESGLLHALRTPVSREEALARIGARRPELVEALLDLGVSLGELACDGRRYRLRGARARALAADTGDPLAAWVQENVGYHGDVYRHFAERAKGGALGRYLDWTGTLIARSSRILEPLVRRFVQEVARERRPRRILEVGCGSGVYLRHAAEASPGLGGVAIDMQEEVVALARGNLARWGLSDRFRVLVADVLAPPAELAGPFDLVTLYNNVYYFPDPVRVELFRRLGSWLGAGGALAIFSALRGQDVETLDFDLVLRSTVGCTPLPDLGTLSRQLGEAGFAHVDASPMGPGGAFHGIVASR